MSNGITTRTRSYQYGTNGLLSERTVPGGMTYQYTYDTYGNITSKTGMGSYTYSTASRPHAVTEVDNTAGLLDMTEQSVSYDSWGNVSSVWQYDNTDFYYHIIDYGPDLKRVTSVTDKTYNTLYEKFYWDDYEEKTVGDDFLQYYYVYGGDGLAGLYIVDTNPHHETSSHATKVITDHLGSITELRDNVALYFKADYDAWGRRTVMAEYDLDPYFDRGYTGHEHLLEEFGLINMNGRMYDPNLGRFLSPDPYVQAPTDPQNFNRYSYCLNNPLKYTDPSGNNFAETLLTGVIDFFTTAFFKGGLDFTSPGSMRDAWRNYDPTAPWSKTNKSWKMSIGFYTLDTNLSSWSQAWQLISRFTWESPQSFLGGTVNQIHNLFGGVKSVGYCCGATVVESYAKDWGAFTIGNYINGNRGIQASTDDPLFRHEYGHYLQSMSWGPLYIPRFGLPSLWDAIGDETMDYPVEVDANKRAFKYFSKYINGFTTYDEQSDYWTSDWFFEDYYISSDDNHNNARSGMSSWKEGLLRFKWYDFIANDPFGFINHFIVYQIMKYK